MGIDHLKKSIQEAKENKGSGGGNWKERVPSLKPGDGETVIFQLMANLDICPIVKVHQYIPVPGKQTKYTFFCPGEEECEVCARLAGKDRKLKSILAMPVYVPDYEGKTYEGQVREQVDGTWKNVKKMLPRPTFYFLLVGPGKDDKYHQFFIDEYEDNDEDLTAVQIRMKVSGEGLDRDVTYKVLDAKKFPVANVKSDPPDNFPELTKDGIMKYITEDQYMSHKEYAALLSGKTAAKSDDKPKDGKSSGAAGWD